MSSEPDGEPTDGKRERPEFDAKVVRRLHPSSEDRVVRLRRAAESIRHRARGRRGAFSLVDDVSDGFRQSREKRA